MAVDTKTALLDSAEMAARRQGFDGFSYADLAADVGIRKASIHYHFPTKAVLSVALMQRYAEAVRQECAEIDATEANAAARLIALIALYRAAMGEGTCLCLCVALSTSRDSLSSDVVAQIRGFRAMMTGWIADAFAVGKRDGSIPDAGDPKAEGSAMLGLLEGAQLAARAEVNPARFDDAVALLSARLRAAET